MATYRIMMTESRWYETIVVVEADSGKEAELIALQLAENGKTEWKLAGGLGPHIESRVQVR